MARKAAADTLAKGLADEEFWDGEGTVRLLTWLHVAVVGGFLAIMLGVTARAVAGGSPHVSVLGWTGIALGAATIALAVAYVCLDALDTPSMATPGAKPTMDAFAKKLPGQVPLRQVSTRGGRAVGGGGGRAFVVFGGAGAARGGRAANAQREWAGETKRRGADFGPGLPDPPRTV